MEFSSAETKATQVPKMSKAEKRKEKSREASRQRRSQEMKIFTEMTELLPFPNTITSELNKTSILRLTLAFLKLKSFLDSLSFHELMSMLNEKKSSMFDGFWPQALGRMLLVLSCDGDIVYITENVVHQLGITQVDLIGESFYDYCHTDNQNELHRVLSLRADGELGRSFFLRLQSILTTNAPNKNRKTITYKVMNCSGRVVLAKKLNERCNCSLEGVCNEKDEPGVSDLEPHISPISHFLVVVLDPIPYPFKLKMPLDNRCFTTNHSMDMKVTYVDKKICQFLGYTPEDLKGVSVNEFHHPLDSGSIVMSYKTMFSKGQVKTPPYRFLAKYGGYAWVKTPPYRFLAKYGGYAWVQTQAIIISVPQENVISKAVVCIHTCLSEIHEANHILSASQAEVSAAGLV